MTDIDRISSGIPGLDVLLHGGIPARRTTLITGQSGTGKSVLCLQIASNLARRGRKTLLVAVEEPAEDLASNGDALGFEVSRLIEEGLLRVADFAPTGDPEPEVSGDYDMTGLIERIRGEREHYGVEAVIIDSSTALFSPRPDPSRLRRLFFQLVYALRRSGVTSVISAEAPADQSQLTTLGVEDFVSDLVINLGNLREGDRRRRSIEICKYRRSAHAKGEYPCCISSSGLGVYSLDAAERPVADASDRFSSGISGLDGINQGGWLRDSLVLVRGPTGSGKTILASMYARAGAERGERVAYYGFEESRSALLRNLAQLELGLSPFLDAGSLRVNCRFPDATSIEDLLIDLRVDLESFQPSLIVIDSISSIEQACSAGTFRQLMIGLASLLRQHGRSALLTQTIPPHADTQQAVYLSMISDAILLMDYDVVQPELARRLRVLKMRGSSHSAEQHRFRIERGGIIADSTAIGKP